MSIPELTARFDASWAVQSKRYQELWAQHEALKERHQRLKDEHEAVLKQLAALESKALSA